MIPTISPQGQTVQFSENIAKAQELHWRLSRLSYHAKGHECSGLHIHLASERLLVWRDKSFGVQATAESNHYFFYDSRVIRKHSEQVI